MKTKYILGALVFPALITACTNDEFESIQSSVQDNEFLEGRATGNLVISGTRGEEDANTRIVGEMNGSNIRWMWEGGKDRLGAVLVDYLGSYDPNNMGNIVDQETINGYVTTNIPLNSDVSAGETSQSAEFSSERAVVEGAYIFYNQYNPQLINREPIKHTMKRLNYVKYGEEEGLKQVGTNDGGQNFFISPMVDARFAEGESTEIPVSMKGLRSILHFKLHSDFVATPEIDYYKVGVKVYKIAVSLCNAKDKFYLTQIINPKKLAEFQSGLDKPELNYFHDNGAIRTKGVSNDQIDAAMKLVSSAIEDPTVEIGNQKDGVTDLVYILKNDESGDDRFTFDSKDDVMELMVVMPAGEYHKETNLENYDKATEGILRVTVYTSQGTYDTYINVDSDKDGINDDSKKFLRGKKYTIDRTMYIGGGKTNVNLYDLKEGFPVETTEDWNYAIDYITTKYRDMGQGSTWTIPQVNLSEGVTINVDGDHFFPSFPVKYKGNATLNITKKGDLKLDPINMILDKDNRPTIQIEDNENATVTFETWNIDNEKWESVNVNDKINGTKALKLISDSKIKIADEQEVNFELLTSFTELTLNEGAIVNATANTATTAGVVTVNQNAKFNVASTSKFYNTGTIEIVSGGLVDLKTATAENQKGGSIVVSGELKAATLKNLAEATITVEGNTENPINVDARGIADVTTLVNNGTIMLTKGGDLKGNKPSLVKVNSLTNTSIIDNDGDLQINTLTNTGTINVLSNLYTFIAVKNGKATVNGKGSIVLTTPQNYEKFKDFTTQTNDLANVQGVIEAKLNQAIYETVFAQWKNTQYASQERAWDVLNKITIEGKVVFNAEMGDANEKDFVLPGNAEFVIAQGVKSIDINSLFVEGTNNKLNAVEKGTLVNVTESTKGNVVNVAGDLTVEENVKMIIAHQVYTNNNYMLNILGNLTNNGTINTVESTEYNKPNKISTLIQKDGSLINKGYLSQASTNVYSNSDTNYAALSKFIKDNFNSVSGNKYQGKDDIRVEFFAGKTLSNVENENWTNNNIQVSAEIFAKLLYSGTVKSIGSSEKYAAYCISADGGIYALYFGNIKGDNTDTYKGIRNYKANTSVPYAAEVLTKVKPMPTTAKTLFTVKENNGTLDLRNGKAWGEIEVNNGTKMGDFEKE